MESKNPALYEINTRVFLRRFDTTEKRATISDIPLTFWEGLQDVGINCVWLMGVWESCSKSVAQYCFEQNMISAYKNALKDWRHEDVIGSPYAINRYSFNSDLGSQEEFQALRSLLNSMEMKLILDFIPNHFGRDSIYIETHPDVFLDANDELLSVDTETFFLDMATDKILAHGRDPFFPAWKDTVQLNYFKQETIDFMIEQLAIISKLCDGVRCDMAMLILNNIFGNTWRGVIEAKAQKKPASEFWSNAIKSIKNKQPQFLFIAEAYWDLEFSLQQCGFDFTYDKKLYDRLKDGTPISIFGHLNADDSYQAKSIRFIENHEEDRAVKAFGPEKSIAAMVVISTIPGMKLYYDGQFIGKKIKLPIQLGREPEESTSKLVYNFYPKLLQILKSNVFKNGEWDLVEIEKSWHNNNSKENVLAWQWRNESENRLVVVNYSQLLSTARIKFDTPLYLEEITLTDLLTGKEYTRSTTEIRTKGLYVELPGWQSHIFKF